MRQAAESCATVAVARRSRRHTAHIRTYHKRTRVLSRLSISGSEKQVDIVNIEHPWLRAQSCPWHVQVQFADEASTYSDGDVELAQCCALDWHVLQLDITLENRYLRVTKCTKCLSAQVTCTDLQMIGIEILEVLANIVV